PSSSREPEGTRRRANIGMRRRPSAAKWASARSSDLRILPDDPTSSMGELLDDRVLDALLVQAPQDGNLPAIQPVAQQRGARVLDGPLLQIVVAEEVGDEVHQQRLCHGRGRSTEAVRRTTALTLRPPRGKHDW